MPTILLKPRRVRSLYPQSRIDEIHRELAALDQGYIPRAEKLRKWQRLLRELEDLNARRA